MSALEAEVLNDAPSNPSSTDGKQKQERERSTIGFPYLSLDVALEIAKAVHATGGSRAGSDQVAAHMGESANSGSFRNKVVTARIFGLAMYSNGTITLTPLGSRVADPEQEKAAKAEAFLHVPLYRRIYDDYKGLVLPPTNPGLEAVIVSLGVSDKQKDKARQAFQRSATLAGFFAYGTSKLVAPTLNGGGGDPKSTTAAAHVQNESKAHTSGTGGGDGGDGRHPLIEGLIKALPAGGEWTLESRRKWLQAAAMNFDFVYTDSAGDQGSLKVSIEREGSAK